MGVREVVHRVPGTALARFECSSQEVFGFQRSGLPVVEVFLFVLLIY